MEVNVASRKDLADAIQSYNDNDNITFISGAKLLKDVDNSCKRNCTFHCCFYCGSQREIFAKYTLQLWYINPSFIANIRFFYIFYRKRVVKLLVF